MAWPMAQPAAARVLSLRPVDGTQRLVECVRGGLGAEEGAPVTRYPPGGGSSIRKRPRVRSGPPHTPVGAAPAFVSAQLQLHTRLPKQDT